MSKERSILKISALGILTHSVRLLSSREDFRIHEIALSLERQPQVLFQPPLEMFSSYGTVRRYLCCRSCQMGASYRYETGWPTSMGSWKLNDPPLIKGQKTDDPFPVCFGPTPPPIPPQHLLTSPLLFEFKKLWHFALLQFGSKVVAFYDVTGCNLLLVFRLQVNLLNGIYKAFIYAAVKKMA